MNVRLRLGLCLVVLVLGTMQTLLVFQRSLIPYEIDGVLEDVRSVTDTRQQLFEIKVDGHTYEVDNSKVGELDVGRHLHKDRWGTMLEIDDSKRVRLPIGQETFQFGMLTLIAVGATWLLTSRGGKRTEGTAQSPQIPGPHYQVGDFSNTHRT